MVLISQPDTSLAFDHAAAPGLCPGSGRGAGSSFGLGFRLEVGLELLDDVSVSAATSVVPARLGRRDHLRPVDQHEVVAADDPGIGQRASRRIGDGHEARIRRVDERREVGLAEDVDLAGDRVAGGEQDVFAGLAAFDRRRAEARFDEADRGARRRRRRIVLGDERDLVLVDHQLRKHQIGRIAVAAEEPGVVDAQVPARGIDQVGQPPESAEEDRPGHPKVGPDELDRRAHAAADRSHVERVVPTHARHRTR